MSPHSDRAAFGTLLAFDALARSHGAGGLSPALVEALTAASRFTSRSSRPEAEDMVAGSLPEDVVWLEDYRRTARARTYGQP